MARDPDTIQREIEQARNALAVTLDELGTRANPQRFVESGKESVRAKLDEPKVRYSLIAVAVPIRRGWAASAPSPKKSPGPAVSSTMRSPESATAT